MSLRTKISRNLYNIPGWRTNRHILVIESDDWGSIRMPSKKVYDKFLAKGIRVDKCPYCKNDCLESEEDLHELFEVLRSVRDKNGRNAILTANAVVVNPNFEKIRCSNFEEYHFEPITDTFKRYGAGFQNSFEMWKQGMTDGIFFPQSHGREHLNILRWMKYLNEGLEDVVYSFNNELWGLSTDIIPYKRESFMAAFDADTYEDLEHMKSIVTEGLDIFEKIVGYRSKSFIAPNYVWSDKLSSVLRDSGVEFMQGSRFQFITSFEKKQGMNSKRRIMGKKDNGLVNIVRNCMFEPSQTNSPDRYIDECISGIESAFFWKKPAVICSHRLNFIGSISEENRRNNLKRLKTVLNTIVNKYPDVEFMNSAELGQLMRKH